MNNYQLYKTNILLGGLVCWDLALDSDSKDTFITDFHLTPINHMIPYNYLPDEQEINYSHQYNISKLYKNISGNFYNGYIHPNLLHDYPIISDNIFNTHENTYEMGAQRTDKKTYGKQYEFFCPIWLEQLNNDLSFDIIIKNLKDNIINITNIKFAELADKNFHNKFVKYFKDYISYIGLDKGDDNVIKIDLSSKNSFISGLEVTSGNKKISENNALACNILSRERPLMEVDSMIINSFKLHNMIASQLFNFRFHFNMEDLFPIRLLKLINWGSFKISMRAKIDNKIIPCMDTFDNYNFIPRKFCTNKADQTNQDQKNILDYLKDNQCIDLLNKNKLYSSIIHWSLNDQNSYVFNVYDGFAGYSYDKNNNVINHSSLYADTPDIYQKIYSQPLNNIGWCECIDLNNIYTTSTLLWKIKNNAVKNLVLDDLISNYLDIYNNLTDKFGEKENPWVHNIKYDYSNINFSSNQVLSVLTCHLHPGDDTSLHYLINDFENKFFKGQNTLFEIYNIIPGDNLLDNLYVIYYKKINMFIFVSSNLNNLTFAGLKELLTYHNITEIVGDRLNDMYNILNAAIDIPVIRFDNSLMIQRTPSPSLLTQEIEYYKKNNIYKTLLRYDGKIKPTFLSEEYSKQNNIFYYKLIISHAEIKTDEIYSKYIPFKYPPLFPSIKYYAIKTNPINYKIPYNYIKTLEYKWYNDNKFIVMPDSFNIQLEIAITNESYISIEQFETELYNLIQKTYNFSDDMLKYVKTKYNYLVLDDYLNDTTKIIKHIYKVKLNLI